MDLFFAQILQFMSILIKTVQCLCHPCWNVFLDISDVFSEVLFISFCKSYFPSSRSQSYCQQNTRWHCWDTQLNILELFLCDPFSLDIMFQKPQLFVGRWGGDWIFFFFFLLRLNVDFSHSQTQRVKAAAVEAALNFLSEYLVWALNITCGSGPSQVQNSRQMPTSGDVAGQSSSRQQAELSLWKLLSSQHFLPCLCPSPGRATDADLWQHISEIAAEGGNTVNKAQQWRDNIGLWQNWHH